MNKPSSPYRTAPKPRNPKHNMRKSMTAFISIGVFCVVILFMYIIFPKTPQSRALKTVGGVVPSDGALPNEIYSKITINELMAANTSAVPNDSGEFTDWIELYNGTGNDINLNGVGLSDRQDRVLFVFPEYVMKADSYLVVYASDKNLIDTNRGIFHAKFKLSSIGETVYLYEPNAFVIDSVNYPQLSGNESYAKKDNSEFEITKQYSPGFKNSEEGFLDYRASTAVDTGSIIINEICPDPVSGYRDEDDELSDWIELFNTTDKPVSLANYALSDKESKPLKWRFPADAAIPANGYYVVFASGKDRENPAGEIPHTNFNISAEHETIVLSDAYGRLVDRATVDNIAPDSSIGRDESNNWRIFNVATLGSPNNDLGASQSDNILRALNPTGVIISEIMASNDDVPIGSSLLTSDFIELYNSSANPVNIGGCGLSDNIKRPRKWTFPSGTIINAGEYKIISIDSLVERNSVQNLHASFNLSRFGGEYICFSDPTGRILDRIPLPALRTGISYGRTLGMSGFFYYDIVTPGTENLDGFFGFAQEPELSLAGGQYKNVVNVTIKVPENSRVYFTFDGSVPDESSSLYNQGDQIEITKTTCLRAIAYQDNLRPSEVLTASYLINMYHSLPVVSLVMDPDELYNPINGIFTVGENIDKSNGIPFGNAVYREFGKIERPGHIEIYDVDGSTIVNQNMEAGLQGQYSLDMPQKTLKIRSKARYGDKYFEAELFDNRPFTEYKAFMLRNSGNDCVWTRINDAFLANLIEYYNTPVLNQAWRPVVMYINGIYWGQYNMRERVDRFFVAQHEGIGLENADNMDILEASGKVAYGSNTEYKEMIAKIKKMSPGENEEDLQYIKDNIDVDNYLDYMAIEMYYGNSDPGNIRYYKLDGKGQKWKWILYDMDYGMFNSGFDSVTSYLNSRGAGQQNIDNTLILKLLENDEMKDLFLTKLGKLVQLFTTDFMIDIFDKMVAQIEPEMQMHFTRWAELNDKAINIDSPQTPEGAMSYWYKRLDRSRNVMKKRPAKFYEMVQEYFELSDLQMYGYFGDKPIIPDDAI